MSANTTRVILGLLLFCWLGLLGNQVLEGFKVEKQHSLERLKFQCGAYE